MKTPYLIIALVAWVTVSAPATASAPTVPPAPNIHTAQIPGWDYKGGPKEYKELTRPAAMTEVGEDENLTTCPKLLTGNNECLYHNDMVFRSCPTCTIVYVD